MDGISVFQQHTSTEGQNEWLDTAMAAGATTVFTSLHIPEEDATQHKAALLTLGQETRQRGLRLVADISAVTLRNLPFLTAPKEIWQLGLDGVRIDDGISPVVVSQLSQTFQILLNASTLTQELLFACEKHGLERTKVEAWHNYYPRPNTGVGMEWLYDRNQWIQSLGIKTAAFVAGDAERRGPLYDGLPTVERQRHMSPYTAALQLKRKGLVDYVLLGDPAWSMDMQNMWQISKDEKCICLRYRQVLLDAAHQNVLQLPHTTRLDPSEDVVRSAVARRVAVEQKLEIAPLSTKPRRRGTITIDNSTYGRYQGELQLVKRPLPIDQRVNVVGEIVEEDLPIMELMRPGESFRLLPVQG
ncbi:MupG family TIM beta-alpha barrel fold protein [Aureibacillus halotolerans]|uniref:Outer surface protein n=1 Tax=Aureibacillus halotolerans TaxID=1508390 RepID=A0A4R6U8R7_9BACI|nr:MupG family TIM beta-alpha barrel fold protein [Aureibacillus halotolerans]TDQ42980.1 hypothetical protein EV213_101412 [Aureibacillus halotolerans]